MPGIYDFFLNRNFSGPIFGTLFNWGLEIRDAFFTLRNGIGFLTHPMKRNFPIEKESVKKVLIIKTERVGDIVLSTPALHTLRTAIPQAQIDYLVPSCYAKLLNCYAGWDNIHMVKNVHDKKEITELGHQLSKEHYDVVIIQHRASYAYKLGKLSKAPVRIGWNAKGYGYLLSHPIYDDRSTTTCHQVINNIRLLQPLGIYESNPVFPVRSTAHGTKQVKKFFDDHAITTDKPIIIIHPASYSPRKQWYPDRYAELIDRCCSSDLQTIVIGSGNDKAVIEKIFSITKKTPINGYNAFDLEGLVCLLKASTMFIGNFTGPMHIASSVGIWTIAIFGDRYKMDRLELWRPYTQKGITIMAECKRTPCIVWSCPDMICFKNITVDTVWNKIQSCLSIKKITNSASE